MQPYVCTVGYVVFVVKGTTERLQISVLVHVWCLFALSLFCNVWSVQVIPTYQLLIYGTSEIVVSGSRS